jgi:hypothetical protein
VFSPNGKVLVRGVAKRSSQRAASLGVPIVCRQHCSDSGDGSINGEIVVGTSAHGRISASLPSLASHLRHVLPEILIKRIGPSSCRKTALRARGWDSGRISAERSLRHSDSATSDGGLRHRGITRAEYRKVRTSTSHPWIRETSDTAEGSHLVYRLRCAYRPRQGQGLLRFHLTHLGETCLGTSHAHFEQSLPSSNRPQV